MKTSINEFGIFRAFLIAAPFGVLGWWGIWELLQWILDNI